MSKQIKLPKGVEQRGSRFRAVKMINGKKHYSNHDTVADAVRALTKMQRQKDMEGVIELPSHDTLAAVIAAYTKAEGHWCDDKQNVLDNLSRDIGHLALSKLSRSTIVDYIVGTKDSPWRANSRISYLASTLKHAKYDMKLTVRWQEFEDAREELSKRKLIGRSNSRTRRTDQDEIDMIAECAGGRSDSIDFAAILQVLAVLPIRVGELCNIRWSDIDTKKRTVLLRNRKHPDPKVKARNDELIPLVKVGDKDTFDMVVTDRAKYGNQDGPFPYTVRQCSSAMTEARKTAGVNEGDVLHTHDLRAHSITKMLKAKIDPLVVMQISGHKNPAVFFKHYVRFDVEDVRAAVEKAMAA